MSADTDVEVVARAELLPCPFCGGTAYVADDYGSSFSIKCNNPICGGAVRLWATREKAIAAWNRRAAMSADPRVKVLEEALEKARDQFRFYEREHKAKVDASSDPTLSLLNAKTNMGFADMCDTALSRSRGGEK